MVLACKAVVLVVTVYKPGADKQNGNALQQGALDESQLRELLQIGDQALALLDLQQGLLIWCTPKWLSTFPRWPSGTHWPDMLNESAQLEQLLQSLSGPGSVSGDIQSQTADEKTELTLQYLSDGTVAMKVQKQDQAMDDVHLYMQAREHMFTTSRTISVSEMATTLAHEIKQPIATISNILKGVRIRLKRDDMTPVQLEEALGNALEQAQFTNSVINRIRDFTQSRRPQQQTLNVVLLVRDALSLMDWLLSANQCSVEFSQPNEPLLCQGDPTCCSRYL